jgi:hypothetical protein
LIDVFLINLGKVIAKTPQLNPQQQKKVTNIITHELMLSFFPYSLYHIRTKSKNLQTNQSLDTLHQVYKHKPLYYLFVYPMHRMPFAFAWLAKKINGGYLMLRRWLST